MFYVGLVYISIGSLFCEFLEYIKMFIILLRDVVILVFVLFSLWEVYGVIEMCKDEFF